MHKQAVSGSSCAYKRHLGNNGIRWRVRVFYGLLSPRRQCRPVLFTGKAQKMMCGAAYAAQGRRWCWPGGCSFSSAFFFFLLLVVPFVATRSQLEQEQERMWVRRVVAMTCLKPLKS